MQATRDCPLCKIQWPTPHTSGFFWAHIGGFFWELQCCINQALDTVGYEVEAPGSIPRAKIQRQNCLQITSMIKSGDNFGSYPFCYGSVYQIWSSVRGTPDSTPEIKISRCHHNRDVLADNSTTSLVCVLRHFSLCVSTDCYGSPWLSVRHYGRTSFCRAGSQYGILLTRNRKCPSMVGYPGYSFTPRLYLNTSMPHAHPMHKDCDSGLWWNLEILISGVEPGNPRTDAWLSTTPQRWRVSDLIVYQICG